MIVNCPDRIPARGISDALVDTSDILPSLVELAETQLPAGHAIDGHSIVPILRGDQSDVREWIFSYLGDRRVLRSKRWLLEQNSLDDFGQMYDCGNRRDGSGYRDVTQSDDPEVLAARQWFEQILATKPVPRVDAPAEPSRRRRADRAVNAGP